MSAGMSQAQVTEAKLSGNSSVSENKFPKSDPEVKVTRGPPSSKSSSKLTKRTRKDVSDMKGEMNILKQQLSSTTEQISALTANCETKFVYKFGKGDCHFGRSET